MKMEEEKRLPMGTKFRCHWGWIELPSQILSIEMFDELIICECERGTYTVQPQDGNTHFFIEKIK